jgi:hypothetical protein
VSPLWQNPPGARPDGRRGKNSLDSISSIEHSTSKHGFRQFMVGVASQLREHGRSAPLTLWAEPFPASA